VIRPKRKKRVKVFRPGIRTLTAIMLFLLFITGVAISLRRGFKAVIAYTGMWLASYPVIYKGTCSRCIYYGIRCPIPLEGSLVDRFFEKSDRPFGYMALFWAAIAYLMRICIPSVVIIRDRLGMLGAVYYGILKMFWVVHLWIIGCPNCINSACPFNPDCSA